MRDRNKEKIISIDFDWVLAQYDWYKWAEITWLPMKGSINFVKKLQKNWYTPVIHTTRRIDVIEKRLQENDFPKIEVTNTKYPSILYIDDRCLQFTWNYEDLNQKMKEFDVHRRNKEKKIFEDFKN